MHAIFGVLRLRIGAATAVAALAAAPAASAYDMNGFLPAAGEGAVALSFTAEGYDHFWAGEQRVSAPPGLGEVDTRSLTLWGRYGLTDRLSVVVNLPYVDTEGDGTARFADSGISDLTALVAARLVATGRHSLTGAGGVRTDVGDYEGDAPVSLGDATTDALLRLVYQYQAGGLYVSQQVGFDLRGGDAPDGVPLHTELGYTFGRTTLHAFYTRYVADGGTDIGDPDFTFPSNQEEYERAGGGAYLRLWDPIGVSARVYTTLDGRNTGDATGVSVGGVLTF